jgi:hypothetical protein
MPQGPAPEIKRFSFKIQYLLSVIFILGDERSLIEKVAQKAAQQSDLLKAVNLAALRARARKLGIGEIIKIGGYELVVDVDALGEWMVVHAIYPRKDIEALASEIAAGFGIDIEGMSSSDRTEWMSAFLDDIKAILEKWS